MSAPVPHICLLCYQTENYYGRLVFSDETEPATCPNHKEKGFAPRLVPADNTKVNRRTYSVTGD